MFRPRLLRETAEIALNEIKRFVEARLTDDFSLRRVSAPLYLPVASGLNDAGETVRFRLPGSDDEMEIVRGLDRWLRRQLRRYDIAPGFGVFTVMNAIRPEVRESAIQSPHLTTWAWQQAIGRSEEKMETIEELSRKLYQLLIETEEMIIEKLPHLSATLPKRLHTIEPERLAEKYPESSPTRREYQYLHDNPARALLILSKTSAAEADAGTTSSRDKDMERERDRERERDMDSEIALARARIVVWNPDVKSSLCPVELTLTPSTIGGNIFRDTLAMQILHQPHILR